jgi:hypothetical protein
VVTQTNNRQANLQNLARRSAALGVAVAANQLLQPSATPPLPPPAAPAPQVVQPNTSAARQANAIPPNPEPLDGSKIISAKPAFVKQSELESLPEFIGTPEFKSASGQGDLQARRREFEQLLQSRYRSFSHTPNVLDQYANVTYHLRWSVTDDITGSAVQNGESYNNLPKTTIAESGATAGFNIVDFELENICAPNEKSKVSMYVSFKMTLKEPYGFSLIDKIYTVSKLLGVKNHLTNSSFLEIWFTGYNEDGTQATTKMQKDLYKLLRINVTKMDCDITAEGSTYRLEGVFDNMYANSDHVEIVAQGLNIGPVETVGQFFNLLQAELNSQQTNLEYDFTKRLEYKIEVPSWMSNWKFSKSPSTSQRNSSISLKDKNNISNPTISISRGMDINTILNFVISMTESGQKYVAGESRQPGSDGAAQAGRNGNSLQANGMANLIMVHSKSQIIGFDYLTNDYVRRITYSFHEYPTARAMIDQVNVASACQPAQQRDRESVLSRSGRYNKRYEYIYTGRNLDIIKMDIRLEWFWQTGIPSQLGDNVYSNFTAPPQLNQNGVAVSIINQYRDARNRLARARVEKDNLKKRIEGASEAERRAARAEEGATFDAQLALAEQDIKRAEDEVKQFGSNARRFQVLWDDLSSGEQLQLSANGSDRNLRIGDKALLRDPAIAQTLQARERKNRFLEDIDPIVVDMPLPLSFRPNPEPTNQISALAGDGNRPENSSNSQGPANLPSGRSLVATVLNDVTTSPYFAAVDLEIRGDPYWIGLGNVEEDRLISKNIGKTPTGLPNSAWFLNGETGFYLTFRTGEEPSETTGFMEFNSSSIAFTGLYNVISVKSLFQNGKFTQTLKAIKDSLYLPKEGSTSGSTPRQ